MKGEKEWTHGRVSGEYYKKGENDVDILIRENGDVVVDYKIRQ